MDTVTKFVTSRVSTFFLCCLVVSVPVLAAPPLTKVMPAARPVVGSENERGGLEARGSGAPNVEARATGTFRPSHLDLRLPTPGEFAASSAAAPITEAAKAGEDGDRFTFTRRGTATGEENGSAMTLGLQAHAATGVKAFGDRFRREGLPIARLWENHSALVSLGLNQKGKPGLWLTQKTH